MHLTWENEAHLEVQEAKGELEIVYPPSSILAEPHVAWVDANVERKGTREVAEAYLRFLYTEAGQEIIAKHHYRPIRRRRRWRSIAHGFPTSACSRCELRAGLGRGAAEVLRGGRPVRSTVCEEVTRRTALAASATDIASVALSRKRRFALLMDSDPLEGMVMATG